VEPISSTLPSDAYPHFIPIKGDLKMDLLNLRSNLQKIYVFKMRLGFLSCDTLLDATKEACELVFMISGGGMIEHDSSQNKTIEPIENPYDHYLQIINEPDFNDQIVVFLSDLGLNGKLVQVWKGVKTFVDKQQKIGAEELESAILYYCKLYTLANTIDPRILQEVIQ
jgi:hypothetical protein